MSILSGVRKVDMLMISMKIMSESSGAALSKSGKITPKRKRTTINPMTHLESMMPLLKDQQ